MKELDVDPLRYRSSKEHFIKSIKNLEIQRRR